MASIQLLVFFMANFLMVAGLPQLLGIRLFPTDFGDFGQSTRHLPIRTFRTRTGLSSMPGMEQDNREPNESRRKDNQEGPLTSSSVAVGPCISPPTVPGVDFNWIGNKNRKWYFPFGSKYTFYHYAEMLMGGRSAADSEELKRMCIVNPYGFGFRDLIGYGERVTQKCGLETDQAFICIQTGGSVNSKPELINAEKLQVIDTDNNSYLLMTRCINGQYKDYEIASTTPFLSREILDRARSKVIALGFDEKNIMELGCNPGFPIQPNNN